MQNNILKQRGVCVGCGICAGMCSAISMECDENINMPMIDWEQCINCGKCIRTCPFLTEVSVPFEDTRNNPYIGAYLKCSIGISQEHRKDSASGGVATTFLQELFRQKVVDGVVAVGKAANPHQFFEYNLYRTLEELRQARGSAYYPVEISKVLSAIRNDNKRVAIIGLPCVIRGLRNAIRVEPELEKKIVMLVGLACGGLPQKTMVEYLAREMDMDICDIKEVSFREKSRDVKCNDSMCRLTDINQNIKKSFYYLPPSMLDADVSFGKAYLNKMFGYDACDVCCDALAEQADIVFMDAWLPEYEEENLGTSMLVMRTSKASEIIDICQKKGTVILNDVSIETVLRAQRRVNLIQTKKEEAFFRRLLMRNQYHLPPGGGYLLGSGRNA